MQQSIVVFSGPPLAGKSTLGARIAHDLNSPYLEMDEARKLILPGSTQSAADRDIAYRAISYATRKVLAVGVERAILCATYTEAEHRAGVADLVTACSARLFIVSLVVDPDEAVRRLLLRPAGHAAVDLTEDRVRALAESARPFAGGLVVNTSAQSQPQCVDQILRYITSGNNVADIQSWISAGHRGPRT